MRTTIALATAALLLAAVPAFAGNGHTPQTEFSGPGSANSTQQKDLQTSQAPRQPVQPTTQKADPQDPQKNPHDVRPR
jgi:hypothetical protein